MRIRWVVAVLICGCLRCSKSSSDQPASDAGAAQNDARPACNSEHFVLDPKDGKCKLDGTTTNVGAACMGIDPSVCGTDQNASCLDELIDDFPGGYCNVDPCSELDGHLCPVGASCVQLNGENGQCFKDCASDADCRKTDAYFCLDMTMDDHPGGLWISGASRKICSRPQLTCPGSPRDCPSAMPKCVLPDGGVAYPDGGTTETASDAAPADAGQVAPPTPICVK